MPFVILGYLSTFVLPCGEQPHSMHEHCAGVDASMAFSAWHLRTVIYCFDSAGPWSAHIDQQSVKNRVTLFHLDVTCEGLEQRQGILRHGVYLGPLAICGLTPAGWSAHFSSSLVVGHVKGSLGGCTGGWAPAVLTERWPAVQLCTCAATERSICMCSAAATRSLHVAAVAFSLTKQHTVRHKP